MIAFLAIPSSNQQTSTSTSRSSPSTSRTLPDASRLIAFSLVACGHAQDSSLDVEEAHLIGEPAPDDNATTFTHPDEPALLDTLTGRIDALDPDIITGWNVLDFDLKVLEQRYRACGKTFEPEDDTAMPDAILDAEELIPLTIRRSTLTGLSLDSAWGSIGAFEFLYITELHARGIVAPTLGTDAAEMGGAPCGLIVPPQPGIYDHVFVLDFKSLYPSIIRTFNIDPLALHILDDDPIVAPNGARFNRIPGILPQLLEQFFTSRDEANARNDELASNTYKIVMNSFYRVLATTSCRFAAPELVGAIIGFGFRSA